MADRSGDHPSDARGITVVDARGLRCPLPLIRTQAAIRTAAPGGSVYVLATDPEAPIDIAAWCFDEGHEFVDEGPSPGDAATAMTVRRAGWSNRAER